MPVLIRAALCGRPSRRCSRAPQASSGNPPCPSTSNRHRPPMRFLAVEGVIGKEAAIGRELSAALQEGRAGGRDPPRRRQHAHTRADGDRQPHRRSARQRRNGQPAADLVHDAHGHGAAVRRREAEAGRAQDRQRRQDRARRRQPRRLRRSRHAGGRACRSRSSIIRRSRCCSACARRAACGARATSRPTNSARRSWPSTTMAAPPPMSRSAPSARIAGRSRSSAAPRMPASRPSAASARP